MHVVATAGHVDHGKSTLVLALTGTDPDRFAEEKARGLTIDLGFAFTPLPSGREVAFVDVPGHVRFLKNMLAGVGAVDACLFVVAATEGWKPQSEEHLRILSLLGISAGVVALTKVGLVDDDDVELARLEIEERAAGTFLADAEVVAVDAPSGRRSRRPAGRARAPRWPPRPSPSIAGGPASGSIVRSRPRARAPSSPARSPAGPSPPTTSSTSFRAAGGCGCGRSRAMPPQWPKPRPAGAWP